MEVPIFPSCSYLIVLGASGELKKTLQSVAAPYQVHLLFAKDPLDAANICRIITYVIGYMIFAGEDSKADRDRVVSMASGKGVPHVALNPSANRDEILQALKGFLASLMPKGLAPAFIESANTIFNTFIKDIGAFTETDPVLQGFDRQINFSMVAGNLIGYFVTRLKSAEIAPAQPGTTGPVETVAQEAANQTLGLIGQTLVKLGIQTRVGLPTVFNLSKIPEIQTLAVFPSVHLTDAKKRVQLSLGFVDVRGAPLFDLSGIGSVASSGDVEFL